MDSQSSPKTPPPTSAKLKLAGAFTGVLEVELDAWTIPALRETVARRSDCEPSSINLICGGKVLKDGEEKLSQLGIKNNAKILVTKVAGSLGESLKKEMVEEEERLGRLDRIKAAAAALAGRHADGSLPLEDFNLELEDQSGQKVRLGSETDREGIMMGLMLHTNAKSLIKRKKYKEALDVLAMGEESFSLCDPKLLEMIDNVPILQIDTVWCYFMLRDINWLSLAGVRLVQAREGIERCHGKDGTRVRMVQGDLHPEVALYLRLELLEGVVAYHSQQFDKCRKSLTSAQAKFDQLQIPDEALSLLMGMGYKEKEATRALRMNKQNVERAVEFLLQERERKAKRKQENLQRKMEIMEQKQYGVTPLKKAVNLQRLNALTIIGFEKSLAAEALRRNENDTEKALDDLTNPEINSKIQLYVESRKAKRARQAADVVIEELVSMGFDREQVAAAVREAGTQERALDLLTGGSSWPDRPASVPSAADSGQNSSDLGTLHNSDNLGASSSSNDFEERDVEMEDALAGELQKNDAFADYDIEVTKEGEAIREYMALLASTENA